MNGILTKSCKLSVWSCEIVMARSENPVSSSKIIQGTLKFDDGAWKKIFPYWALRWSVVLKIVIARPEHPVPSSHKKKGCFYANSNTDLQGISNFDDGAWKEVFPFGQFAEILMRTWLPPAPFIWAIEPPLDHRKFCWSTNVWFGTSTSTAKIGLNCLTRQLMP